MDTSMRERMLEEIGKTFLDLEKTVIRNLGSTSSVRILSSDYTVLLAVAASAINVIAESQPDLAKVFRKELDDVMNSVKTINI